MAKKRVKRGSVGKRTKAKKAAAPKRAAKKTKKAASKPAVKRAAASPKKAGRTAPKTSSPPSKRSGAQTAPATARPASQSRPAPASAQNGDRKRSAGLSSREIEEFRGMLLAKRNELVGDVSHLHAEAMRQNRQDAAGDLSSMPIHMADIGTDNYEQEFTLGLIESERAILREIDEALRRIDDGTYGLCVATGEPIGKKRLKANPWAKYSYEYKLAQEKGMMRRP